MILSISMLMLVFYILDERASFGTSDKLDRLQS